MDHESPVGAGVLDAFRKRATERKGCPSIDALDNAKGSGACSGKGLADPSSKLKKRPKGGEQHCHYHPLPRSLPTPPPRREAIEVDSPSPDRAGKAIAPPEVGRYMEVPMSPLACSGDLHFPRPPERSFESSPHQTCSKGSVVGHDLAGISEPRSTRRGDISAGTWTGRGVEQFEAVSCC